MPTLHVDVISVRSVARHQADITPSLYVEEDRSGLYTQLNRNTLYSPAQSAFLELSPEAMAKALQGHALRVSSQSFS